MAPLPGNKALFNDDLIMGLFTRMPDALIIFNDHVTRPYSWGCLQLHWMMERVFCLKRCNSGDQGQTCFLVVAKSGW